MGLLSVLLVLTAAVSCSSEVVTYGTANDKTELLIQKAGYFEHTTTVTFNKDNKHDLIIDKVEVTYMGTSVGSYLDGNGPWKHISLKLVTWNNRVWVGIAIHGRMNKGKKSDINPDDVKFA